MAKAHLGDILKTRFKAFPKLYYFLVLFFGSMLYLDRSYKKLLNTLPADDVIVNLGSGPFKISASRKVINVDIETYKNVDVVADIQRLPFKTHSLGGIINIAVLEHVRNPHQVIVEMARVLRPGGYIYTVIPFIHGFHASPDDYCRWTPEGLKVIFSGFQEVESGVHSGPTSGLLVVLHEWLAMLFSFQNRYLYQVLWVLFMILLSPFKILDFYLSRHPEAAKISGSIYYICKKSEI